MAFFGLCLLKMRTIEKTYLLDFPLARVYAAWVSSDTVIPPAKAMEVDPVPAGIYRLIMPDDSRMNGKFLAVVPNQHLRYTWDWEGDAEVTEISVDFKVTKSGTSIQIVHSGFLSERSYQMHSDGWDSYIEGFQKHLQMG